MALSGAGARDGLAGGVRVWSVSGLMLAIGDALAARFSAVAVQGEISGFSRASSGHCYFTLKDGSGATAGLRCAMFRRAALAVGFAPQDGQQVELRGRLAVYEARGELQMVVESMQRVGAGNLYEEFVRLKARLQAEGLFESALKRPLPPFPRRLALVTSPTGAAVHDVLTTLARRAPHIEVVLVASAVQGAQAPESLVRAMASANRLDACDLVLLCRGGGSIEDLWSFNDERVVRAVRASRLPVVCGVGHETDITLADLAADVRAPTPTAAAELAAPPREDLLKALALHARSMARCAQRRLESSAQHLDTLAMRLQRPGQGAAASRQRLEGLAQRMGGAVQRSLDGQREAHGALSRRLARAERNAVGRARERLTATAARLSALDPKNVLQRGYAWVEDSSGTPLLTAGSLRKGQAFRAVWIDGYAEATVRSVHSDPPLELPNH